MRFSLLDLRTILNWSAFNNEVTVHCDFKSYHSKLYDLQRNYDNIAQSGNIQIITARMYYSRHYLIDYITFYWYMVMSYDAWTTIDTYIYISCLLLLLLFYSGETAFYKYDFDSVSGKVSFPVRGAQQVKCCHLPGRRWREWVRASLVITWSSYRTPYCKL